MNNRSPKPNPTNSQTSTTEGQLVPKLTVIVRFNPSMKWWQASIIEQMPGGFTRPYRASLASLIVAGTHAQCIAQVESVLDSLGVAWSIEDAGNNLIAL